MRNAQFNAVTPVLAFGKGPWELGRPDYRDAVKDLALWHHALHPYIYDAVLDGDETGFPYAVTPLPIAFPDDPNTYGLANDGTRQYEWLFGPSLLATPVFGSDFDMAQTRDVYLPAGRWIDYATGAVFHGPRTLDDYAIGTDRVPAFVGGKGVLVLRGGAGMVAEVYPVTTGSTYEWTDGDADSSIENANTGWDPELLRITDLSRGEPVEFTVDDITGALRFAFEPGHDYKLSGGGEAADTVSRETAAPSAAPTSVTHTVDAGQATLSWQPVDGARSYTVSVRGSGQCGVTVAGSTTETSLPLGSVEGAVGVYTVAAVNALGSGPASQPYEIHPDGPPPAVIVTNEGTPPTCDPDPPAYVESGRWASGSLKGFDGSGSRYSSTQDSTASWSTRLGGGSYAVEVWFPQNAQSTTQATYEIRHAAGTTRATVDQVANGGRWVPLGTFEFTATELASVSLLVTGGTGYHRADAVRFTPVAANQPD